MDITAQQPRWWATLNTTGHRTALNIFMAIVLAHWAEHLVQAFQIWVLGWPVPDSRGLLGGVFPVLARSESLHYGYALVMLVGLVLLRPGFTGRARTWWTIALGIQVWHHFEHLLLISQAHTAAEFHGHGGSHPSSILQMVFPRVEVHLFYNAAVFVPMVVAMVLHLRQSDGELDGEPAPEGSTGLAHSGASSISSRGL